MATSNLIGSGLRPASSIHPKGRLPMLDARQAKADSEAQTGTSELKDPII